MGIPTWNKPNLRQRRLEQMQLGVSPSRDQCETFGTVTGQNGILVAPARTHLIVRDRVPLKVDHFDQALGDTARTESDGEPARIKLDAVCLRSGSSGSIRSLRTTSPSGEIT